MIVDTSALTAILRKEAEAEAEAERFARAIAASPRCRISAANLLEAGIIADNRRTSIGHQLGSFIRRARIVVEPVTEAQVAIAGRRTSASAKEITRPD